MVVAAYNLCQNSTQEGKWNSLQSLWLQLVLRPKLILITSLLQHTSSASLSLGQLVWAACL